MKNVAFLCIYASRFPIFANTISFTMNRYYTTIALLCLLSLSPSLSAPDFQLLPEGYFNSHGVDVMAFSDFYPEGHQGGVCVIMNGRRVATNGDIRLEATPGQWQPVPKQIDRKVEGNSIVTTLCYPDSSRHLTGFNPMVYPDYQSPVVWFPELHLSGPTSPNCWSFLSSGSRRSMCWAEARRTICS